MRVLLWLYRLVGCPGEKLFTDLATAIAPLTPTCPTYELSVASAIVP